MYGDLVFLQFETVVCIHHPAKMRRIVRHHKIFLGFCSLCGWGRLRLGRGNGRLLCFYSFDGIFAFFILAAYGKEVVVFIELGDSLLGIFVSLLFFSRRTFLGFDSSGFKRLFLGKQVSVLGIQRQQCFGLVLGSFGFVGLPFTFSGLSGFAFGGFCPTFYIPASRRQSTAKDSASHKTVKVLTSGFFIRNR